MPIRPASGEQFTVESMTLRTIELDAAEKARQYQRAVVYETFSPLISQGRAGMEVTTKLAESVIEHLTTVNGSHVFDDYMQAVVQDVLHILKALVGLAGKRRPETTASVRRVLDSKTGVQSLISKAISLNAAWNEKAGSFLKWQAAWTEHGPALAQSVADLTQTQSLTHVEKALRSLPVWRDVLEAGFKRERENENENERKKERE